MDRNAKSIRTRVMQSWHQLSGTNLLIAGCLLLWLGLGAAFILYGYNPTWRLWNVPVRLPPFYDLRVIPATMEAVRQGIDPTVENPADPAERPFNYPRIWYLLAYTGISDDDTIWLGVVLIVLFFVGVWSFPQRIGKPAALLMLLALFSPAAMFLYERANVDLFIFFLCALVVILFEWSVWGTAALLLVAALLKLFPFFGIGIFLFKGRAVFWRVFAILLAVFALYLVLTSSNVQASWDNTPRGIDLSYGANVWLEFFRPDIKKMLRAQSIPVQDIERHIQPLLSQASIASATVLGAVSLGLGWLSRRWLPETPMRNLAAFVMGAAIYCATFLMGSNWDYRLIFLVLTLPALAEWAGGVAGWRRGLLLATVVLLLLVCWYALYNGHVYDRAYPIQFVINEICGWSLYVLLAHLLGVTIPEWARVRFRGLARARAGG